MSRDNNLGMWSTGANGVGGGGAGEDSGYYYLDDYSGSSSPLLPPSTYGLFTIFIAMFCLISFHIMIALVSML